MSAPFDFLNDPNGGFHIGVEGRPLLNDLFFGKSGLFEVEEELLYDLVALKLVFIAVVDAEAGDVHLYLSWSHPHFEQELIQVDVLRAYCVGVGVVADEVEFKFDHS